MKEPVHDVHQKLFIKAVTVLARRPRGCVSAHQDVAMLKSDNVSRSFNRHEVTVHLIYSLIAHACDHNLVQIQQDRDSRAFFARAQVQGHLRSLPQKRNVQGAPALPV
jgi:hypothetical protein